MPRIMDLYYLTSSGLNEEMQKFASIMSVERHADLMSLVSQLGTAPVLLS